MASEATGKSPRRAEILRVAAELFASHGYHATGVKLLSDTVKIGRGGLYYHIGSKERILYEISKSQVDALLAVSAPIAASGIDPLDKLKFLTQELIQSIVANRAEWVVFFREFSALGEEHRRDVLASRDAYEALWASTFAEGYERGQSREVSVTMLKSILGMFNYSYLWLRADGSLSPREIADDMCSIILKGVWR